MSAIEAVRTRFRPQRITTLFVGESPPRSGDFFYCEGNAMLTHMRRAVESVLGESDNFLKTFLAYGWYLDDLVLEPVDKLSPAQRRAQCLSAQSSLADRIKVYRPEAIVSVVKRSEQFVNAATDMAGSTVPRYGVVFPGMGNQNRFHAEMVAIIQGLPRLNDRSPPAA
jgi:hypothetical protein